jgi:hypothetical protein
VGSVIKNGLECDDSEAITGRGEEAKAMNFKRIK